MRDYFHDIVAYSPDYIAFDNRYDGWSLMDHDGCVLMLFDTKQEALDEVRKLMFQHLERLLESDVAVITFLPDCAISQRFQRCWNWTFGGT